MLGKLRAMFVYTRCSGLAEVSGARYWASRSRPPGLAVMWVLTFSHVGHVLKMRFQYKPEVMPQPLAASSAGIRTWGSASSSNADPHHPLQGSGNYAFCWPYVTGTRRLCVTHPGLAGFRTQSSDIFKLFISQRTLQPTYRGCIIIKNCSWNKCSGVTTQDRDLLNWELSLGSSEP